MKINKIQINGFGKIQNKEINLDNGINIIKGKNESGKSTTFNFIKAMLYGISRNKRGKNISDYERYKPWKFDQYSGKLEYELSNGKKYQIFRNFNKKLPEIYNENGENISVLYGAGKNKDIPFFFEQTKIDENLFLNSTAIGQKEVEIDKSSQSSIIQKISNLATTGDDSISFQKAMDKLKQRQLDEIGSDRTKDRPINKINREIISLNNAKKEIGKIDDIFAITDEINQKVENVQNDNKELEVLKQIQTKYLQEKSKIEALEKSLPEYDDNIKYLQDKYENIYKEDINSELERNINKLNLENVTEEFEQKFKSVEDKYKKLNQNLEEEKSNILSQEDSRLLKQKNEIIKKQKNKFGIYIGILCIILSSIFFIMNQKIPSLVFAGAFIIDLIMFIIIKSNLKNKLNKVQNQIEISNKNREIKLTEVQNKIEMNNKNKEIDINNIQREKDEKIKNKEIKIKELESYIEYNENNKKSKLNTIKEQMQKIDYNKKSKVDEINRQKNTLEEILNLNQYSEINTNNINKIYSEEDFNKLIGQKVDYIEKEKDGIRNLEMRKKELDKKINELSNIEEDLEYNRQQLEELENKNEIMELAKSELEQAYKDMAENVTPEFSRELSNIVFEVSNEKYKRVKFNDDNIFIEVENGQYVPIYQLSTGTIDQLYFALRMAILKEFSTEELPIFLDESFAFYDNSRLIKGLEFLRNKLNRQVILFTCNDREEKILDNLNVKYNKIEL